MAIGTLFTAAREGVVIHVEESHSDGQIAASGLDNFIVILHSDGTTGLYGHLTRDGALVEEGKAVRQGEEIGRSGNTGNTNNRPHLHFSAQSCDPVARGTEAWSLRRIERTTGVRRETISGYLKAVGVAVPGRGRRRAPLAKPAISTASVSTDSGGANPAISEAVSTDAAQAKAATRAEVSTDSALVLRPGRAPSASACEPSGHCHSSPFATTASASAPCTSMAAWRSRPRPYAFQWRLLLRLAEPGDQRPALGAGRVTVRGAGGVPRHSHSPTSRVPATATRALSITCS